MSTLLIIAAVIALASQAKKKTQKTQNKPKPKPKPKGPSQTAINEAQMEIDRIREMAGGKQETREELEGNPIATRGVGLFDPIIPAGANTDGTTSQGAQKLALLAEYGI